TEALDTTTVQERLVFHMFGALAEFERSLIRERTQAGLAAARRAGRTGGGRQNLPTTTSRLPRRCWPTPTSGVLHRVTGSTLRPCPCGASVAGFLMLLRNPCHDPYLASLLDMQHCCLRGEVAHARRA